MNIPGLDFDKIVENIVDIRHSEDLEKITDDAEREAKRQEFVDYYSSGDAAKGLQQEMNNISNSANVMQSFIKNMQSSVSAALAPGTTPQVLVVGQATGAPNPAWGKLFTAALKGGWLANCDLADFVYSKILESCATISFNPPGVLTALKSQLDVLRNSISVL